MSGQAPVMGSKGHGFTRADIDLLLQNLDRFDDDELAEIETLVSELETREYADRARKDLIAFAKHMMDDYIVGVHHRRLADLLMDIECGKKDRITVSVAPRHGKSQLTSLFYAAWYIGNNPTHKIILASHTAELAVDFGRKIRDLLADPRFQQIFPNVALSKDSKSAGRWNTNQGGEFFACGVGGALAGRGAHLLLIDDPHSEQDILAGNFENFEKAYQWYRFGARTRLMPGGRVAIIATRWSPDDLIGRLHKDMVRDPQVDQFEVFEFPAIWNEGTPEEKALWPEFFDLESLKRTKASMPLFQWNAQYQQNPTGEEAALVKREWWRRWRESKPPECEYIIASLDAAAETHNRADYTSITIWGVFSHTPAGSPSDADSAYNIILLNAIKDRFEFPELKQKVVDVYNEWEPDSFIVEKKSAGVALYQEFRRAGVPIQEFTPHRGTGDKTARLNSVSDIISSGLVWVPEHQWADDLIEEFASFPFGKHDDQVDSGVMALMRFRKGGFIQLPSDPKPEVQYFKGRGARKGYYV